MVIYREQEKTMFDDCLIMAGGSGTRLWPASSSRLPKQFLPASENLSFFSMAVERALAVTGSSGKVIIITGKDHVQNVIADSKKLSAKDKKRLIVIREPAAKNTAPAVACAVSYSLLEKKKRNMLVLTSDHIIKPLENFKKDAALAAKTAAEGNLVVLGIPPTRPETGYGYIEIAKTTKESIYRVSAFHEKPDLQTAKKYSASKLFFWNSGMFAFNNIFMAEQFLLNTPDVYTPFEKLKKPDTSDFVVSGGIKVLNSWKGLENAYKKTKKISFDYAIAEKCRKTSMIRVNFDWIDIGNWEEYAKICKINNSQVFSVSGNTCFVDSDIPVALAGVEDLIIVIRTKKNGEPKAALITKKGHTQKVRDIVELIKKDGKTGLL